MSTFTVKEHITTIDAGNVVKSTIVHTTDGEFYEHMLEQHLRQSEMTQEFERTQYQRDRVTEYPPLTDLADALYWQSQGDESKMTAYLAAVDAVKAKYPKASV